MTIDNSPARLMRWQQLFPDALGVEQIRGSRYTVPEQIRKMQRRGEVIPLWRFTRQDGREMTVPLVRLKTRRRVRVERAVKVGLVAGAGFAVAYGIGWALWQARFLILGGAVLLLSATLGILVLAGHWSRGCPGLHCRGCGG